MADRATRPDDPRRSIVELDKDERWQARLAEARARREIALKQKAAGHAATESKVRRKPWEEDGHYFDAEAEPIEPIILPDDEHDDRIDFSDRVKTMRETVERRGDNEPPPGWRDYGEDDLPPDPPTPKSAKSVADRYISALSPDFEPVKPYVPPLSAPPPLRDKRYLISYDARTHGTDADDIDVPASEPEAAPVARRRRGAPLLLLAGVCAMAILPFSTEVAPLEMGPLAAPDPFFRLEPALGITRPMNEIPRTTVPGEFKSASTVLPIGPLSLPLELAAPQQREIASLGAPPQSEPPFGALDWVPLAPSVATPGASSPLAPLGDAAPVMPQAVPSAADLDASLPSPEPLSDLRVTILLPATGNIDAAELIATDIESRGHTLATIRPINLKITERNVRFFHEEDRGEAARLAESYDARLRDFTSFRPAPPDGTVEIWLAGEGEPRAVASRPVRQVRSQPAEPPAPTPRVIIVQRPPTFIERLTGALGGGHVGDGLPDAPRDGGPAGIEVSSGTDASGGTEPAPDDGGTSTGDTTTGETGDTTTGETGDTTTGDTGGDTTGDTGGDTTGETGGDTTGETGGGDPD